MVVHVYQHIRIRLFVHVHLVLLVHYVVILVIIDDPNDHMWDDLIIIESFSDITTTISPPSSSTTIVTQSPSEACLVNSCLNGGFCLSVPGGGFHCICPTGYTGLRCDYSGSWSKWVWENNDYSFCLKPFNQLQVVLIVIVRLIQVLETIEIDSRILCSLEEKKTS